MAIHLNIKGPVLLPCCRHLVNGRKLPSFQYWKKSVFIWIGDRFDKLMFKGREGREAGVEGYTGEMKGAITV